MFGPESSPHLFIHTPFVAFVGGEIFNLAVFPRLMMLLFFTVTLKNVNHPYLSLLLLTVSEPRQQPPPMGIVLNGSAIQLSWNAPDSPNSNSLTYILLRNLEPIHTSFEQLPFG